jgi:septum formation protein
VTPALVLASRSPQRRAILEQLGVAFEVRPTAAEELGEGDPREVALTNARRKAAACELGDDETVLAFDTLVALDGAVYGKPPGATAAAETLRTLGGRTHEVVSGLVLAGPGATPAREAVEVTSVTFRALDDAWIDWYVATGEWQERAGGYAIQGRGAALVRAIAGDYLNVVGLPVTALLDLAPQLARA